MSNNEYNASYSEDNQINYSNDALYNDKYVQNEFNKDHDNATKQRQRKKISPLLIRAATSVTGAVIVTTVIVLLAIKLNYQGFEATQTTLKIDVELENIADNMDNEYTAVLESGTYKVFYDLKKVKKQTVTFTDLKPYTEYDFSVFENKERLIYSNTFSTTSYFSISNEADKTVFTIDYPDSIYFELIDIYGNSVPLFDPSTGAVPEPNVFSAQNRIIYDEEYTAQVFYRDATQNKIVLEERVITLDGGKVRPQITTTPNTKKTYVDEYIDSITLNVIEGQYDTINNTPVFVRLMDAAANTIDCGEGFNNTNTFTTTNYLPLEKKEYTVEVYDFMSNYVISKSKFTSNYQRYLVDFVDNTRAIANVDSSINTVLRVTSPFGEELPFDGTNTNNEFIIPTHLIYNGTYKIELYNPDYPDIILESREVVFPEVTIGVDLKHELSTDGNGNEFLAITATLIGTLKEPTANINYFYQIFGDGDIGTGKIQIDLTNIELKYDSYMYEEASSKMRIVIYASHFDGTNYKIAETSIDSEYKISF